MFKLKRLAVHLRRAFVFQWTKLMMQKHLWKKIYEKSYLPLATCLQWMLIMWWSLFLKNMITIAVEQMYKPDLLQLNECFIGGIATAPVVTDVCYCSIDHWSCYRRNVYWTCQKSLGDMMYQSSDYLWIHYHLFHQYHVGA